MYGPLYDDKHKIFTFKVGSHPDKATRISLGEYDNSILCSQCDHYLGRFENYGRGLFKGSNKQIHIRSDESTGSVIHHITGTDYNKFKLFLLSILWKSA